MKRSHLFTPIWLLVHYSTCVANAQASSTSQAIIPALVQYIESQIQDSKMVGIAIAAVHADSATEYGAWGKRNEEGENMTTDTLNNMGSLSKAFTATAMGILIDDFANGRNTTALPAGVARLEWETKVKDLLPGEWELMDAFASEKSNLRDLLSHLTGVIRNEYSYGPNDTLTGLTQSQKYFKPAFELRERWSYNNQMYMIASHIIATYAGSNSSFTKFVEDRIFAPLNMSSSTYSSTVANQTGKFAQGFTSTGRRLPYWLETDLFVGAGGVISTAEDLTKWVKMHMNAGVDPATNQTVNPAFNDTTTARAIVNGNWSITGTDPLYPTLGGYGMGWERISYQGHDVVFHNGDIPGFNAWVGFLPSDGFGFVVTTNADQQELQGNLIMLEMISAALNLLPSSSSNTTAPDQSSAPVQGLGRRRSRQRRASDSTTDGSSHDFTGMYNNLGYGNITFCDASSTSSYCQQLLVDFSTVDAQNQYGFNVSAGELFASWGKLLGPQIRLVPLSFLGLKPDPIGASGTEFAFFPTSLFPNGYGANSTAFEELLGEALVVFDVDGDGEVAGFGLFDTAGEVTDQGRAGGTIEETADAYFAKV